MQLVYFPINVGIGVTPFPLVPNLAAPGVKVVGLCAYVNEDLSVLPDSGQPIGFGDGAERVLVTLCSGSNERFDGIPYTDLVREINEGVWMEFEPFEIDLAKCEVRTTAAIVDGSTHVAFVFIYQEPVN